jgi:hypothetical protein
VKHPISARAWLALGAPILLGIVLLIGQLGCGSSSSSSPTPVPTTGFLTAGLTDSPSGAFQHVLLNLVSVRLNPSTNANVLDTDPNWATIPLPPNQGVFATVAALQIDLNQLTNNVRLFNSSFLVSQTYNQIELQVDQNVPGTIVPNCGVGAPSLEGCIAYPAVFPTGLSTFLRTSAVVQVGANAVTPLVIDITLPQNEIVPPTQQGGPFTITPTISVIPSTNLLGTVTGTAPIGQTINAELTGTGTVLASTVPVVALATVPPTGTWVMQLPASPLGTAYDLYTTGPLAAPFSPLAYSDIVVTRGGTVGGLNFNGGSTTSASFAGNVAIAGPGTPIQGATVNVGLRALNNSNFVIVGTGSTDNSGNFPLPGTAFAPAPLTTLGVGTYQVSITASGFDPIPFGSGAEALLAFPGLGGLACSGGIQGSCNFLLTATQITGSVTLDVAPPSGTTQQVLVTAEDAGTNNLENVTMVTIPAGATAAPFTLEVPTTVASFDMILSAQDQFQGAASPYPGHTIFVANSIPGGATGVVLGPIQCNPGITGGHGSISGTAVGSDQNTSVMLFKTPPGGRPVALMSTTVAPQISSVGQLNSNANQFSFCAPADTYTIERLENGTLVNGPISLTLPVPAAQSTPCPSVCGSSFANCPSPCTNTSAGSI